MLEAEPWIRGSRTLAYALAELPAYLVRQRWFPGKDAGQPALSIEQIFPLDIPGNQAALVVWRATAADRALRISMPLALVSDVSMCADGAVIGRLPDSSHALIDATALDPVVRAIVTLMMDPKPLPGHEGDGSPSALSFSHTSAIDATEFMQTTGAWTIKRSRVEQSNTSIRVGHDAIIKFIRKLDRGIHPELELGRFLTERAHFAATPALLGWMDSGDTTLAIMQAFVANDGDGWTWVLDRLRSAPTSVLDWLQRLGERTGELHVALAQDAEDPAFAPEDIVPADWQTWQESVLEMSRRASRGLENNAARLSAGALAAAREYAMRAGRLDGILTGLLSGNDALKKTRHHGDYHLGQVLVHDGDAVIVDFEGEPMRPLAERRAKHCALRDVAGMVRSLGYAAAVAGETDASWLDAATTSFLRGYFLRSRESPGCPRDRAAALRLVQFFTMEKALYEVLYELANRPEWVEIPLLALNRLLLAATDERGGVPA